MTTFDPSSFPALHDGGAKTALMDGDAAVTYAELDDRCDAIARGLLNGRADLEEERIALLLPTSSDYVAAMHGIWRAGGMAVPLNTAAAESELEHYLGSTSVTRLITTATEGERIGPLCRTLDVELITVDSLPDAPDATLPDVALSRRAMIVFTSGTTSKPKGVVSTHANIRAQVTTLLEAWAWSADDAIPLPLPLHHVHGIINVLSCALWVGATIYLQRGFDAERICNDAAAQRYTLFMAVPTIYVKLIDHLEALPTGGRAAVIDGFAAMRLNVSGSAACPVTVFERWQALTGQVLLERYGMTEIGMALSNPYRGERRAGHVGQPLPGVEVALFDENDQPIAETGVPGEIRVRGPSVFLEYWDNPAVTEESFADGWFRTGDIAVVDDGYFRIMGRSSIDIIKSGGYKLSALEIEGVLLTHDAIREVAVIGAPDDTWGETVVAFIVGGEALPGPDELRAWCEERMAHYKVPRRFVAVDSLPRNAMGKVTKPALRDLL